MNNPIEENSVQATMVMPLWGRVNCSKLYPDVLEDSKAHEIYEQMVQDFDFDVGKIEHFHRERSEYYGLVFCTRARHFDDGLQSYLKEKPNAIVVNLGAGMETGYYRNDNGNLRWFEVDLPNVIKLRDKYLPGNDRHKNLPADILELSWIEKIPFSPDTGIFFIAGGLFMYFSEFEIKELLSRFAEKFPVGELMFDGSSRFGMKFTNKRTKKAGRTEMLWKSSIDKNFKKQFECMNNHIKVVKGFSYWSKTQINPKWNSTTQKMIKISTFLKMGKFVHLKFQ